MCGIAGYLSFEASARQPLVKAMCDRIVHRGPDDEGFYADAHCAIGMRRLSIIDLSGGHQPISNEDGSIWVVFNGEVYNYQELRRDLIARGHQFRTDSDTETLIHLYEQEGVEGIAKLRGMFAYAIWDSRRKKLLLARDRFGKKPLYIARRRDGFYFASELKCLHAAGIDLTPNPEAIQLYLNLSYVPEPWSAMEDVEKLPGGTWLQVSLNGNEQKGRYWSVPRPLAEGQTPVFTETEAHQEMVRLFDESVRMRMIADVPLGAFLSGGIDSSLVVASMALQSTRPVKTFSIGFEKAEHSELPYARAVATQYRTEHQELIVTPNHVPLIETIAGYLDEPFADSSAIPTYLVSEFTARHVKVALSGDGGDEFWGGYQSFFDTEQFRAYDRIPGLLRRIGGAITNQLPSSAYGRNRLAMACSPTSLERYFHFGLLTLTSQRATTLEPPFRMEFSDRTIRRLFGESILPAGSDPIAEAMHFEATTKLTGDILTKVDRMSMAVSLEVRCPLLDHKWAEFANTLPHRWKFRNRKGKLILLDAFRDRIPPQLLNRPKQGFGLPLGEWFRRELRDFVRDHLHSSDFFALGVVSRPNLDRLLSEHQDRRRDNSSFVWTLLMLKLWHERYAKASGALAGASLA